MQQENIDVKTHKDLNVWKRSIDFVTSLYKLTSVFPKEEVYGLTNHMRQHEDF